MYFIFYYTSIIGQQDEESVLCASVSQEHRLRKQSPFQISTDVQRVRKALGNSVFAVKCFARKCGTGFNNLLVKTSRMWRMWSHVFTKMWKIGRLRKMPTSLRFKCQLAKDSLISCQYIYQNKSLSKIKGEIKEVIWLKRV